MRLEHVDHSRARYVYGPDGSSIRAECVCGEIFRAETREDAHSAWQNHRFGCEWREFLVYERWYQIWTLLTWGTGLVAAAALAWGIYDAIASKGG